ncbi:OmpA family protein [Mucilaginibacter sp. SP1R1]|uniref:OmpA family protein n=1 Tax=Mucilaginibacter sp. SP1R1 TaxID=2723091 RepID=UPI00160A2282|nr:OmpA family protein [Mucilaginibacter sp. SP1R1]MBB6152065.1 outer membrane protein OmpA-like peptidoglycan-associated protein/tetratricopeptide (TPR) repeat protein [Mucilaginibacter sp. SP1R1]
MKKTFITILILILFKGVNAQYSKDNPRAYGDKAFSNKDYYEAAFYYKKAAEGLSLTTLQAIPYHAGEKSTKKVGKKEDRAYICYQLAESYRLYENYLEAEGWYYKVINENYEAQYPLSRLWYGVCLRANQHFDDAIKQLEQFNTAYNGDAKYKDLAQKEIRNCHFAKEQYQYPLLIDVEKLKDPFASDGSDYALIQRDGNSYFTSSRFVKNDKKHLNRIYTIAKDKPGTPAVIDFKNDENKKELEYGTPSLNENGKRMYLTRWYKEGNKTLHGIYYSDWSNNAWSTPKKLNSNVNADGFNAIQPFVTVDGKRLFFTSNKPGGQGGDDIWVSDLDATGDAVNSSNLGGIINTAFDEEAPYYDQLSKRLIYSSKGFIGLGGFDFFESFDQVNKWTTPKNMGYPMNSAKDDLYYLPNQDDANKFYISSDRESDCCLGLFGATDKRHVLSGIVFDCDTHTPLAGAKVSFIDSLSKDTIKQVVVGKTARYSFDVTTKRPYSLRLEKAGYFAKNVPVPASGKMSNDTLYNPDICLQAFTPDKPIVINNILYDFNKATLRPASKLVLDTLVTVLQDNPKIKVELSAHTDSIGSDKYNDKLSQARAQSCVDYIISKGINETRIYAKGYGKRKPIAHNSLPNGKDNPAGRQLNRRTEFTVLKLE